MLQARVNTISEDASPEEAWGTWELDGYGTTWDQEWDQEELQSGSPEADGAGLPLQPVQGEALQCPLPSVDVSQTQPYVPPQVQASPTLKTAALSAFRGRKAPVRAAKPAAQETTKVMKFASQAAPGAPGVSGQEASHSSSSSGLSSGECLAAAEAGGA